jgi:hypothetical protein
VKQRFAAEDIQVANTTLVQDIERAIETVDIDPS